MKSGKRQTMEGIKLSNQKRIKTLVEMENYNYLGILEADTIKQPEIKEEEKQQKGISGKRERFSKLSSAAAISSKG